ncbi:MAG TPA: hypothetical protein DET40_12475 [Lentisphaeria bacterium]|nr:MAG: hypothetical protein A2X45_00460 [Lentisphaerae bacterium GWF2_50_93]HCE44354.1 hypothetical protein [Lentisphaeria bacterium]
MAEAEKIWLKYFDADTVTKLSHIGIKPSGMVEGNLVGDHKSPFHGFAIEFAGHRGYVPGDDVKHIDWKAYYKVGKYLIKQYAQETNFISHIVIDVSESMKFEYKHGSKIDYAAHMATAMSNVIVNQSDSVGAFFFDNRILSMIKASGSEEIIAKIASEFRGTELKNPSAIGKVLSLIAEQINRRRIVFVISDFFGDIEDTFTGIKRLLDDKHEVVLLQIVDPLELNFDLMGRVELIELEGTGRLEVTGASIKDLYEKNFNEFLANFKKKARMLGIDYILCDMSRPFGFHLAEYLSARKYRK